MHFIVISLSGFCRTGLQILFLLLVAVDLAQNLDLNNVDEALGTVTGIVDGTGGLWAAIEVLVMGLLSKVSWLSDFLFMIATGVLSIVCLWNIALKCLKTYRQRRSNIAT